MTRFLQRMLNALVETNCPVGSRKDVKPSTAELRMKETFLKLRTSLSSPSPFISKEVDTNQPSNETQVANAGVGTPIDVVMARTFIDVSLAFRKEIECWDSITDPAEKLLRGFTIQDQSEHVLGLRGAVEKQVWGYGGGLVRRRKPDAEKGLMTDDGLFVLIPYCCNLSLSPAVSCKL